MGIDVYIKLVSDGETANQAVANFLNAAITHWQGWMCGTTYTSDDVAAFWALQRLHDAASPHRLQMPLDKEAYNILRDEFGDDLESDGGMGTYRLIRSHPLYILHMFCKEAVLEVGRLHSLLPGFRGEDCCGDINDPQDIMTVVSNLNLNPKCIAMIESVYYA